MTKVTVLADESQTKKLKKIEFIDTVTYRERIIALTPPKDWGNIELIKKDEAGYDIMFAFDDGQRNSGALYFGHFNDGIV